MPIISNRPWMLYAQTLALCVKTATEKIKLFILKHGKGSQEIKTNAKGQERPWTEPHL